MDVSVWSRLWPLPLPPSTKNERRRAWFAAPEGPVQGKRARRGKRAAALRARRNAAKVLERAEAAVSVLRGRPVEPESFDLRPKFWIEVAAWCRFLARSGAWLDQALFSSRGGLGTLRRKWRHGLREEVIKTMGRLCDSQGGLDKMVELQMAADVLET